MRTPPPVLVPVGRSAWALAAVLIPVLAGAGLGLAWAWTAQELLRPGGFALAWGATAAVAGRQALRSPTGVLRFDAGGQWCWWPDGSEAGEQAVRPRVALDLQRVMLLKLDGAGPGMWLWLTTDGDPGRWQALRRCLYWSARRP